MCSAGGSAALPASGFPHSGIHGSKAVQRLTVAYRSRPRPSSTLGAKASTTCPYYLDGDQSRVAAQGGPCDSTRLGEPVATTAAPEGTAVAVCDTCAVFKDRREKARPSRPAGAGRGGAADRRNGRSIKTQQHATRARELGRQGPVDMLGRWARSPT